jgi:hypothetical protein
MHVDSTLTPSYSPIPEPASPTLYQRVSGFWKDFRVRLIQGKQQIAAQHRRGGGPLDFYGSGRTALVRGARIELHYDPEQIEADSPTIEMRTPDGQKVETAFDLGRLRQESAA